MSVAKSQETEAMDVMSRRYGQALKNFLYEITLITQPGFTQMNTIWNHAAQEVKRYPVHMSDFFENEEDGVRTYGTCANIPKGHPKPSLEDSMKQWEKTATYGDIENCLTNRLIVANFYKSAMDEIIPIFDDMDKKLNELYFVWRPRFDDRTFNIITSRVAQPLNNFIETQKGVVNSHSYPIKILEKIMKQRERRR